MWQYLLSVEQRRKRLLRRAPEGTLRDFLSVPTPRPDIDHRDIQFLALDFETTGLDAKTDDMLSAGYLGLQGGRIQLGSSCHQLVRVEKAIPAESAVIHRITDDRAAGGQTLQEVVENLLAALAGKVLVAHYAEVEFRFLNTACQQLYGCGVVMPVVDTLELEKRLLTYAGRPIRPGSLRLGICRERYGLPRYQAHDALIDALACAELFLAQCAYRSRGRRMNLKLLLHRI